MKKLFLILFSFLFLGTALTGSVFLLAGCDYSQSQEENNDENFENGQNNENESESNEPDEDDNKPDDTEELAAWYYYAIRFCGTIVVSDKNTSNWSISNIYNSFDDIGGEVSVTGGSSCQTPRVSSTDSSMSTYGGIYIEPTVSNDASEAVFPNITITNNTINAESESTDNSIRFGINGVIVDALGTEVAKFANALMDNNTADIYVLNSSAAPIWKNGEMIKE